jgi:hypothetical protein
MNASSFLSLPSPNLSLTPAVEKIKLGEGSKGSDSASLLAKKQNKTKKHPPLPVSREILF